jgi:signal transduction histidine kinase/ligand-binding sensor domain-containing protein
LKNSNSYRDPTASGRLPARWAFAGLLAVCLAGSAYALDPTKSISQYIYDRWEAEKGFSGGAIYAISQSPDGYLWIGAQRGLFRFDGIHFTLIQEPIPGLPSTGPVVGLLADAEGNLWIRLEGPRMLVYRNGEFHDAFARHRLNPASITAMSDDGSGGMILSSLGEHLLHYSDGKFTTIVNPQQVPTTVISIAETRDRRVWIGTRDYGLFFIDQGRLRPLSAILGAAKINSLLPVGNGRWNGGLWIGTDRGIYFWDGAKVSKRDLPPPAADAQILAIFQDRDGNVWVGTDHGMVRISPDGTATMEPHNNEADDAVTSIFEDYYGEIWFGGSQGIQRLRDGMFTSFSTEQGLPSENGGPVFGDSSGRAWFGPTTGGLYWIKDGRVGHVSAAGLDNDVVYSISGGDGEIWVGRQHGGLTSLREKEGSFAVRTYTEADGLPGNTVVAVLRGRSGAIWAGTVSNGVGVLNDGAFKTYSEANGLSSNTVNSIAEGSDGTIWIATPGGLDAYTNGRWQILTDRDGLPSANVLTLFRDSKNILWVATSGGLAYISDGRVELPRNLPDPLREQIFGMTEDGLGFLWFATSDHLVQVNRDQLLSGSLNDSTVQDYGESDGLPRVTGVRRDRSLVTDPTGRVWVSLDRGLAVADPRMTLSTSTQVIAHIESMSVNGIPISLHGIPEIAAGQKDVAIGYTGGFLPAPDRVRFRYELEGASQGWSGIVASRQVVYPDLGPGSYRFRVVASNEVGLWNGPEASLPFVIEPAFWQTLWFRVACILAFVLAALGFYWMRMYRLTRQLTIGFQERLTERTRIAQELHDTLLQSFQGLMLRFQAVDEMLLSHPDNARQALEGALSRADQAINESREAIQNLRSSPALNYDLEQLVNELMNQVKEESRAGQESEPELRVLVEGHPRTVRSYLREDILRFVREALHNAFVHAQAHRIETEIIYLNKSLRLRVRDDGRGIDSAVLKAGGRAGHWGMVGMKERARRMQAELNIWSKPGSGTEVELAIPGAIAYERRLAGIASRLFRRNAEHHDDRRS